jgi:hypothetical protein
MTYSDETTRFWKIEYKLFHGKFIRFMAGMKNTGQLVMNRDLKKFQPLTSKINFAVPSLKSIREFQGIANLPSEILPGIFEEAIELKAKSTERTSCIVSVDGKKLATGLSKHY